MSEADEDTVDPAPTAEGPADPVPAAERADPRPPPPDTSGVGRSPRWHPSTKIVAGVALGVAMVGAVYLARNALTLIALAGLIAFLVAPLMRVLRRRARFPTALALLTSYAVALVGIVLIGGLIVGGVAGAVSEIDPPSAVESLRDDAINWLSNVRNIEVGGWELDFGETVDPLIENLRSAEGFGGGGDDDDGARILTIGSEQFERLAGGLLASVQTVGGLLAAALVTFLVAMYLSADSRRFIRGFRAHIPPEYEGDADRMSDRLGEIWRGYLYGQLLNSLATGLLVWLVLWAVGLPGSFVFGLIMALLNMIPTFGPIIAAVPGVLAAFALGSTRLDWSTPAFTLLVIAIYIVVVQVQANFMAPFITGRAVRMSPATILVGLLVGFQVGGLVGTLLVVPVLASLKEAGKYVMAKLLDRDPFADGEQDRTEATEVTEAREVDA